MHFSSTKRALARARVSIGIQNDLVHWFQWFVRLAKLSIGCQKRSEQVSRRSLCLLSVIHKFSALFACMCLFMFVCWFLVFGMCVNLKLAITAQRYNGSNRCDYRLILAICCGPFLLLFIHCVCADDDNDDICSPHIYAMFFLFACVFFLACMCVLLCVCAINQLSFIHSPATHWTGFKLNNISLAFGPIGNIYSFTHST